MKTFDWNKWSAIAEIISSIAILITLIYLAIQTQQNTAAIQGSVRQAMLSEDRESLYKVIEYPFLDDVSGESLTGVQKVQFSAYLTAFVRMRENHWLQYQSGVIDEATWKSYRGALVPVIFSSEYGRTFWQTAISSLFYDQGFIDSTNAWVAELNIQDSDTMFVPVN
jgi:hypothetical protein